MSFLRTWGFAAALFVVLAGTGCAPSLESAMRKQHAEIMVSADKDIAEARARVVRAHDADAAGRFADAVQYAIEKDRGFQATWTYEKMAGPAPQRADAAALIAEASRYLDEAATREPDKAGQMLKRLGKLYEVVSDWARSAAAFERALARGFDEEAFRDYTNSLDRAGRAAEVNAACKRLWAAQGATPVDGTVLSPDGERPRTRDDARYLFLDACVQHAHAQSIEAALDWATPADRDFYVTRDRQERADHARWKAAREDEERQRQRAKAEEAVQTRQACLSACKARQDECLTWCHGDVSCHNACVQHAYECDDRCPGHE